MDPDFKIASQAFSQAQIGWHLKQMLSVSFKSSESFENPISTVFIAVANMHNYTGTPDSASEICVNAT